MPLKYLTCLTFLLRVFVSSAISEETKAIEQWLMKIKPDGSVEA